MEKTKITTEEEPDFATESKIDDTANLISNIQTGGNAVFSGACKFCGKQISCVTCTISGTVKCPLCKKDF